MVLPCIFVDRSCCLHAHQSAAGRAEPVKLELPPRQAPVLVELSGTPLLKGFFLITGCRMSCMGVTWHQPWTAKPPTLGEVYRVRR